MTIHSYAGSGMMDKLRQELPVQIGIKMQMKKAREHHKLDIIIQRIPVSKQPVLEAVDMSLLEVSVLDPQQKYAHALLPTFLRSKRFIDLLTKLCKLVNL